jgi:threonine aldolase
MKYSFKNDYSEGAHPLIIKALDKLSNTQQKGYGEDIHTKSAINILKNEIESKVYDIHLIPGGTQTNIIALSAMMQPHEAVICPDSGHINVHEAGAIEATGHKVISIKSENGKLYPDQIEKILDTHKSEHMVKPKVVYISDSTEIGTHYTKAELEDLSEVCDKNNLFLYLDGARLGSALMIDNLELKLSDIANLTDIFYIGGTKNGALFGEALVIINPKLNKDFRWYIKQRGGLLAKGASLGVQFEVLFQNDLYWELAKHANNMAQKLTTMIQELGFNFLSHSKTNQIFPILPNSIIDNLSRDYDFYKWKALNKDETSIRLVTSWATKEKIIDTFIEDLRKS